MSDDETIQIEKIDEEVLNINYWKHANNEISDIFEKLHGLVLITHNSIDFTDMLKVIQKINQDDNLKIFYISLTRSYDFMKMALQSFEMKKKEFFFFDCVSDYAFQANVDREDVQFLKPPRNLNEIKNLIREGIKICNPDMVIIDSISQFVSLTDPNYHDLGELFRFLHHIRTRSLNAIQKTYILFYSKKPGIMQHLPFLTSNLILNIEVIKGDPGWVG